MTDQIEKPGVAEQYAMATNAKNLRVEAEKRGNADILIAAGWSASRVGSALIRLHSEWDGCEHQKMMSKLDINALAKSLPKIQSGVVKNPATGLLEPNMVCDITTARATAADWHVRETKIMLGKLKSLPAVRYQVELQAEKLDIDNPQNMAALVLRWWLDRRCTACFGTRFELVPGTNRHCAKLCRMCGGTSERHIPGGEDGKRLVVWLEMCIWRARQDIKTRLQNYRNV